MNSIKTSEAIDHNRRRFFGTAAMTLAATRFGMFAEANAQSGTTDPAASPAMTPTMTPAANTSFAPLKQIDAGVLSIGYAEAGPANGPAVILLHGWPYDIYSFVDVAPLLASAGYHVIVPYLRGYGTTHFLSGETMRNAQQSAVALDIIALMDALKIRKATVAGFDWGARTAAILATLWPERCTALVSVSGYLIGNPAVARQTPFPPKPAFAFWYRYYFATDVGRAGYAKYLHDFNKLIWQTASPKWNFDEATFDRTAASFDNPDHVDIVIHNYRWGLGLADGEPKYDDLEKQLAATPVITVPTITLEGDANGAIHADSATYRNHFSGKYEYRLVTGGVGHNLPQEAPQAFAKAVIDVDAFAQS
jgi:pimeloyl-ACP methyl ester carboxylesterase